MIGRYSFIIGLHVAILLFFTIVPLSLAGHNPKDRIDFYKNNFTELLETDDPRAGKAHRIFNRLVSVAGRKTGVVPRLFIVKDEKFDAPLAQAIPDGGIIISKKLLDICYKNPEFGDDRLAFILGHELAHQLKDDFWHLKFFQAIEISKKDQGTSSELLEEVKAVASLNDKVLAKELQADEQGILYASLAGFNTSAIVSKDDNVNFFAYFYEALDPGNLKGFRKDTKHPSPQQRAETVKARLKQVLSKIDLFKLGVMFYHAGEFERASIFFMDFLRFFPSREVYHNLGASQHQLALKNYLHWKGKESALPFQLSFSIDNKTSASNITLRAAGSSPETRFNQYINKAIEHYETAISLDAGYITGYNSLACALILKGDAYQAISLLKKVLQMDPVNPHVLNNLGVAFYYAENLRRSQQYLEKAIQSDASYAAPLFNLGYLAYEQQDIEKAKKHWTTYLSIDSYSYWAQRINNKLKLKQQSTRKIASSVDLTIGGVEIGDYEDDIPSAWGKFISKEIPLEESPFLLRKYAAGISVVLQDDEVILIHMDKSYNGNSGKNIFIGTSEENILTEYGTPSIVMDISDGKSLVFSSLGAAFQIRDDRVISWLLF